jgi:tetratricopeptide (TPR) repeat protein
MNSISEFFIYATVFRVAIIAAGMLSIFLGSRLFTAGIESQGANNENTTFDAKVAGLAFALKNGAPGTFFALFGVIIISVMLIQGNPELTLKTFNDTQRAAASQSSSEITVRGAAPPTAGKFDDAVQRGLEYERKGDTVNAIASYEEAMTVVATPMNQLAWDYLQQGKAESALPLARLAVQLCPDKAPFLDTLSEILFKEGDRDEAMKWMEKAAALDPKYRSRLTEFQRTARQ